MEAVSRKAYPTDITNAQWEIIAPLLPPAKRGGRPRTVNMREVVNTILYLNRTACHNVDQSKLVPGFIVPMKTIFPGDNPTVLAPRQPPLNPVVNTPDSIFDDKMAVVNASLRGEERGTALPLLLDLARKPIFLHDNSVPTLDNLLNPARGATAPHPFYLSDAAQRADTVEFLRSLDTNSSNRATRATVRPQREKHESLPLWAGFFVAAAGIVWLKVKK